MGNDFDVWAELEMRELCVPCDTVSLIRRPFVQADRSMLLETIAMLAAFERCGRASLAKSYFLSKSFSTRHRVTWYQRSLSNIRTEDL